VSAQQLAFLTRCGLDDCDHNGQQDTKPELENSWGKTEYRWHMAYGNKKEQ
jgi:hypothetical protein